MGNITENSCNQPLELVSLIISCGFIVGMVVSYLPQHLKIISKRSSEGLSAVYLLLGGISSFSILYNAFLLQFGLFRCCTQVSLGLCLGKLTAFLLILAQFLCFIVICILFIFYFPRELKFIELDPFADGAGHRRIRSHQWTNALIMSYSTAAYAILAGAVAVGLLMAYGDGKQSEITQIYADSLGLLSTVLSFVQFMPQIISTFRSRTVGALSMPSMMIQSPGSFLMAYLIAISEGTNVSTWSSYVASGSLQFILLCIAATWHFRDRWRADSEVSSNSNGESDDYDEGFVDEKQPFIPKEESVEIDNNKSVDNAVVAHSSQSLPLNTAAPVRIPERKRQHYSLTPASLGQFVGKNLKSTAGGGGRVNRSHQ